MTDEELDHRCRQSEAGLNYVVRRVAAGPDGLATLEVDRAGYGQIMRSCDYLIDEAFIVAGLCAQGQPLMLRGRWLLRALPARRTVLRGGITELLTAPTHRAVGVGLAATVVTRHADEQTYLYYTRRSFQVGTYPGLYHAIPTGMFNGDPAGAPPHDQRTHPGRMVLTEFFEELQGAVTSPTRAPAVRGWNCCARTSPSCPEHRSGSGSPASPSTCCPCGRRFVA